MPVVVAVRLLDVLEALDQVELSPCTSSMPLGGCYGTGSPVSPKTVACG